MLIRMDISSAGAVIRGQGVLTVGMVGAVVEFHFSDHWDGLSKTAVFRQGDVTVDVAGVTDRAVIPWEVLGLPGVPVSIGVYGANESGTLVIPTVWAHTEPVQKGADPSGDESADPSLPVWQQILNMIGSMEELDTETLVAAVNQAAVPVYLVTVIGNTADKSLAEVTAAYSAGKVVLCYWADKSMVLRLTETREDAVIFTTVTQNTEFAVEIGTDGVTVGQWHLALDADLPLPDCCVTVTADGDGGYTADKTFAELTDAYSAGRSLYCIFLARQLILPLISATGKGFIFGTVFSGTYGAVTVTSQTVDATFTQLAAAGDLPTGGGSGVYVGTEEPEDAQVWIHPEETADVEYIPVPDAAQVGQTMVVKAVDDSGRPTQWEPSNLDGRTYELIQRVEITETGVSSVRFTGLDLDKFILYIYTAMGESALSGGVRIFKGATLVWSPWQNNLVSATEARTAMVAGENKGGIAFCESVAPAASNSTQSRYLNRCPVYIDGTTPFTEVNVYTSGSVALSVGSSFELWGVKA